ncbi:MAG: glycosyltransferase, partial [Planctomycetes bacterium]|nr:glycosyltransferase [Planctomycetota bacterium]
MPSCLVGIWIRSETPFPLALRTARALAKLGFQSDDMRWVRDPSSQWHDDIRWFGTISLMELFDLARRGQKSLWMLEAGARPIHPLPNSILETIAKERLIGFGAIKHDRFGVVPGNEVANDWERPNNRPDPTTKYESKATLDDCVPIAPAAWGSIFIPHGMVDLLQAYDPSMGFKVYLRGVLDSNGKEAISRVRIDGLDVRVDSRLRIAQVITNLQRGGAERIALDLHHYWLRQQVNAALVAIDAPRREAFPNPPCFVRFFGCSDRDQRVDACVQFIHRFQPDVIHTHLLSRNEHAAFAGLGLPTLTTLHNMEPGWPREFQQTGDRELGLVVSCAKAVELQAAQSLPRLQHRTVWNGISREHFRLEPEVREHHRNRIRSTYGIRDDDWVLLAVANPRPQKRLERIPAIASYLQLELTEMSSHRRVHVVFAGEASSNNAASMTASCEIDAVIDTLGVQDTCHRVGSIARVEEILAAADVLVSVSEFEGLSLAHMEALASGLPVVATDVGGNREIATLVPGMHIVDTDSDDRTIAHDILGILSNRVRAEPHLRADTQTRGEGKPTIELHPSFEICTMEQGYYRMVRGLLGKLSRSEPEGVWLVTNNFSVGGAQSSARRLLQTLHERDRRVRATVLEEDPSNPTPGTQALRNQGIPVMPAPRPEFGRSYSMGVQRSVDLLIDAIDRNPPEALVFWNTIPAYKLLLADGLIGVPIFDVSPGEMNLASLSSCLSTGAFGLPYRTTQDYGARLKGAVVKYQGERLVAERAFGNGCPIAVIPNGVPIADGKASNTPRQLLRIGTTTRLNPHKRVEDLFESLRKLEPGLLSRLEFLVAGGV